MIKGVIFDLDGVIVSTDEYHYQAWKQLADEEGIEFDREINNQLRGVSRIESLKIILKKSTKTYSDEKIYDLAERKNKFYRVSLESLDERELLPGALEIITSLKTKKIPMAIASSSKNAKTILKKIKLTETFDVVTDGTDVTETKPDPQIFLIAAERLSIAPAECLVVEDSEAGIEAAKRAGMKYLGIGTINSLPNAEYRVKNLSEISVDKLLSL
ncbi:MAG: beta-phosphoglucomutase [Melioribacteraceae bacterium]|nr:beta-phosphoglucomutase [Melioribacteraceae bacterium]MCF8353177.1 beta-phosphoglucomutase [Melioribacteraceae bacterium]MCF8395159.1 beta-phosphoglucomutase [Melioribacteraceae bacterium]MCF8418026.1 beta-phosphoglucomutase [Melioribacteraceae bacterium]